MLDLPQARAIVTNTGASMFVNENGDPTGVLDYTDNGGGDGGDQTPQVPPAPVASAPSQGGGFDWQGLLTTGLQTAATALVSPNGTPAAIAAAQTVAAQAQVKKQAQTNTWLIILVVIVVVGILLYFVFKDNKK